MFLQFKSLKFTFSIVNLTSDSLKTTDRFTLLTDCNKVRRCGGVGSTLAFGSIGHGFESEHRFFSYFLIIVHQPSAS